MLPWFLHVPVGSSMPGSTSVHWPRWPGSAQLWHCEQPAVWQQTLSTQLPLPHSSLFAHIVPSPFFATQAPELQ